VFETAVPGCRTSGTSMQWLALVLTPGLGPTKARRVIEFFGSVQALFRASLTELEAAGLRAVSAQSLGTGRSMELAQDELGKAAAADAKIVSLDDPKYPQLKQIYDSPLYSLRARERGRDFAARNRAGRHTPSHALRLRHVGALGL
jgi:hypothetical protein